MYDELRRLLAAAEIGRCFAVTFYNHDGTPVSHDVFSTQDGDLDITADDAYESCDEICQCEHEQDAALITAAVNALPALLDRIAELEAALRAAADGLDSIESMLSGNDPDNYTAWGSACHEAAADTLRIVQAAMRGKEATDAS